MRLIDAEALHDLLGRQKEMLYSTNRHTDGSVIGLGMAQMSISVAPTVEALPLRCRIGDEVWVVGTKCMSGLYDAECPDKDDWRSFDDYCVDCPLDREYIVFPRTVNSGIFADIHELDPENQNTLFIWGETVFLTREEAEAALAKMDK